VNKTTFSYGPDVLTILSLTTKYLLTLLYIITCINNRLHWYGRVLT